MSLLVPDSGLLFWMLIAFGAVFFVLAKFGFPMITKMLNERKGYIDESLEKARQATERLAKVESEIAQMKKEAHAEQSKLLAQAQEMRAQMIEKSKADAAVEGQKMIEAARKEIAAEKESAIRDIRRQVALLSVQISEKVLRKDLEESKEQMALIDRMLDEINDNK
jgi:F-type H+-transporting ATPase subunit b